MATLALFVVVLDRPLLSYKPGQYVSLGLNDGVDLVQRPYSVVSIDTQLTRVELFVRRLPDGRFSKLLWCLGPGQRLVVGPAKGLFTLDRGDLRPRIMVGTGTGIAPLLAMLESLAADPDPTPSVLIHGASYADELVHRERAEGWIASGLSLDYRPTVSRPQEHRNSDWFGRTGRADDQLRALLDERRLLRAGGSIAYLCGNPEMVLSCATLLRGSGFAAADVRVELFHAPTAISAA